MGFDRFDLGRDSTYGDSLSLARCARCQQDTDVSDLVQVPGVGQICEECDAKFVAEAFTARFPELAREPQAPPCPYCGERQTYEDSTHKLVPAIDYRKTRGRYRRVRVLGTATHCRACDKRIYWCVYVETWGAHGVDRSRAGQAHWSEQE